MSYPGYVLGVDNDFWQKRNISGENMAESVVGFVEKLIDESINENTIIRLPMMTFYHHMCLILACSSSKDCSEEIGYPLQKILPKMSNYALLSDDELYREHGRIDTDCFSQLMQWASLNIAYPYIHSAIYEITGDDNHFYIGYKDEEKKVYEFIDTVMVRFSAAFVVGGLCRSAIFELFQIIMGAINNKRFLEPINFHHQIKMFYGNSMHYVSDDLMPNEVCVRMGFTSRESFENIRSAVLAICETYEQVTRILNSALDGEQSKNYDFINEWLIRKIAMPIIDTDYFGRVVKKTSKCSDSDYELFRNFIFCTEENLAHHCKSIPPVFIAVSDKVFFSPTLAIRFLSSRNFIVRAINDPSLREIVNFDENVSECFEPDLISRFLGLMEGAGYSVGKNFKIKNREIDAYVKCHVSNTILVVQAKATPFPDDARMVRNLDGRISEAVSQVRNFRKFSRADMKNLPLDDDTNIIDVILTNGSFGSAKSWSLMRDIKILPLNCWLAKMALCKTNSLDAFVSHTNDFIESLKEISMECNEKIINFNLAGVSIEQRMLDIDDKFLAEKIR